MLKKTEATPSEDFPSDGTAATDPLPTTPVKGSSNLSKSPKRSGRKAAEPKAADRRASAPKTDPSPSGAEDLSFLQSRTALELVLAELQTSDLDVEHMAALYRRGLSYIDRCEAILEDVEQEVLQWSQQDEQSEPRPFEPS
ncbi:exodeoxyribonuclease VII small subunit [Synechococcus sp. CBW1002]|jgi:exodeoxyribonuclease VII small subunit|uniref:exodeoxyribonuclease VII small subunit n=1 Tax=Synechococcus sp. CBW1002 TaxID=1353134 RepID=UPI0018CD1752|nr:exodeoxyribonuclease VII small subunit [Synechococcus sp. CBW1002]QPN61317.1 exodeoxyribonuclease VII small subunit [Synechococcus sp. CBW1002]